MADYYKTLGVSRDAAQAEIQKAYRDLARKHHPDLNPDDKTAKKRFQEIQAAFDVLNDPSKRELYDRYGSSFENMKGARPGGGPAWGGQPGAGVEDVDFSQFFGERFTGDPSGGFADIFSQFRRAQAGGGRRKRAQPSRGADLEHELQVPFATAVTGGEAQVTVRRGDGKVHNISVKIPAGIGDGKKVRLRGQGEPGPGGGPAGDILITVRVAPHPWFTRRGNNLHLQVPVTLGEAAAGAKVDIPSPNGTVTLSVPAGSSSGTKLRVRGQGIAPASGTPGDLIAEVQIVLPPGIDQESRDWFKKFDEAHPMKPRARVQW
jgi:DnaJ-class molecular chaperone